MEVNELTKYDDSRPATAQHFISGFLLINQYSNNNSTALNNTPLLGMVLAASRSASSYQLLAVGGVL